MSKQAIFPGSFDPFTKGHQAIVKRALPLFTKVIIAIGKNSTKEPLFTTEQRLKIIKRIFAKEKKVEVVTYSGLTVDLCRKKNCKFIIRGLRNGNDFTYEQSIAVMNRKLYDNIDTIFFASAEGDEHISSTLLREIYKNGGDINSFLPEGFNL